MKVIYEQSMLSDIKKVKFNALKEDKQVERIILTSDEWCLLFNELADTMGKYGEDKLKYREDRSYYLMGMKIEIE